MMRLSFNDPQVQLVRDAEAVMRTRGQLAVVMPTPEVDIATSLSPFMISYNNERDVVDSSANLSRQPLLLPRGVFTDLDKGIAHPLWSGLAANEARFTWQPAPDVRLATVIVKVPGRHGGYLLAARNMVELERRIDYLGQLMLFATIGLLIISAILVVFQAALKREL